MQADGTGPAVPPVSADPTDRDSAAPPADGDTSPSPTPTPSRKSERPTRTPDASPSKRASKTPEPTPRGGARLPHRQLPAGPRRIGRRQHRRAADQESAAESEVLSLVNQERAKAGCKPLTADAKLAALAGDYSEDMARRGFFSHTSPDGKSPWDRAEAAGVSDLGGENIARGQANARSVMDSWMNSPGPPGQHPQLRLPHPGRRRALRRGWPLVDPGLRLLSPPRWGPTPGQPPVRAREGRPGSRKTLRKGV